MEFSTAVLLHEQDGKVVVEVPPQVTERLGVGSGDVLCWTGFVGGPVEVWSVKKSPYASLGSDTPGAGAPGSDTSGIAER